MFAVVDKLDHFAAGFGGVRHVPAEHLVEHDTEAPDIDASVDFVAFTLELFGGHIEQCAASGKRVGGPVGFAHGESEVGEPELSGLVDEDIPGFEVAVKDAFFVGGLQNFGELAEDTDAFGGGQRAGGCCRVFRGYKFFGKVAAGDVLHDEYRQVLVFKDVQDLDNADVFKSAGHAGGEQSFAAEGIDAGRGIAGVVFACGNQGLFECNVAIECGVMGEEHAAEAAFSKEADDAVGADEFGECFGGGCCVVCLSGPGLGCIASGSVGVGRSNWVCFNFGVATDAMNQLQVLGEAFAEGGGRDGLVGLLQAFEVRFEQLEEAFGAVIDGQVSEAEFESGGDAIFAVELFESIADMVDGGERIGIGSEGDEVCGQFGEIGESLDKFGMGEWLVCGPSEPFAGDEFEFPVGWIGE